jgi:hypothetical protein
MELKGRQVLKIKEIATGIKYNVDEEHTMYGQTYNRYQYNNIVFTVNSNDEFVAWRKDGTLFSADFVEGTREREIDGEMVPVPTLQLVSCTNINQEVAMATAEAKLAKIYKEAAVEEVNEDLLNSLQK